MRDLDLILPDQHRDGRVCDHDNKSPSRCITGDVEGASRYPQMSASLPLRGTDQSQAFNEKLSLYGLWRERGSAIHPVCGKQASYLTIMKQSFGPNHATAQNKKRDLERKVLVHVKKNGTCLYDALSVRFDPNHTDEVQPVLHGLKEYGYIDVARDKMVTITTFGLQQLEAKDLK